MQQESASAASVELEALSDEDIVTRLQEFLKAENSPRLLPHAPPAGAEDMFSEIYRRYRGMMESYCASLVHDREAASDIYHDIFLKIYLNLHRYHYKKSFKAWVYKIARNACVNWMRKSRRDELPLNRRKMHEGEDAGEYQDSLEADLPNIEKSLIRQELRETVQKALYQLPYSFRNIFALKTVAGLAFEDIAQIEKISSRSVKTMYHQVLIHLRAQLEKDTFRPQDLQDR